MSRPFGLRDPCAGDCRVAFALGAVIGAVFAVVATEAAVITLAWLRWLP